MDYNQILIFKSNNKQLRMDKKTEYRVTEIEGIEASSYKINTTSSEQDGESITSKKIESREITINGDIKKNQNELSNRELLIRFFNPKETGELTIIRNEISRKISYEVSSLEFKTNKMYSYIQFTLSIECIEEPYFSDAKSISNSLTAVTPQFAFPLVIRQGNKGKIMGYKTFKPVMPIVNSGDKETGIEIIAIAKRGKVENIKFILNNNKYIKVNVILEQGDELRINTNPRKKSILLNGESIIQKIDRNSEFFSLKLGKNILSYECDKGSTNIDIETQAFGKFLGI